MHEAGVFGNMTLGKGYIRIKIKAKVGKKIKNKARLAPKINWIYFVMLFFKRRTKNILQFFHSCLDIVFLFHTPPNSSLRRI